MYPFERFTEDSKRVLMFAQEEAERSRHSYIGTEHILLALFRQPGVARDVLNSMGIREADVRETVARVLGRSERTLIQQIIPTSRVKKVIEISFEQARSMGSNFVDTGHLLLGLVLEGDGIAAHVLHDLGATSDRLIPAVASAQIPRSDPDPAVPGLPADRYRDVMSALPSGVVIVTAFGSDGLPRGLTVTAFAAVSLQPPLALVCIEKTSNTLPAVQHTQGFTANLLASGREELARLMATKASTKFDGLDWRRSESGAGGPILVADTAAYAVCTLRHTIEAGDHWVLIGTVVDGAHHHDVQPMVYHRRHYGQL
jgi:flavin reductase (NADH)